MTRTQTAECKRILEKTFITKGLDGKVIDEMLESEACRMKSFSADEILYSPESFERALTVILSGKVQVGNESDDGVLLRVIGKGEVFGAASLFGEKGYPTVVKAMTAVKALYIGEDAVRLLITENGTAAVNYVRFLTDRVRFLNMKINIFTKKSAVGRLGAYLYSSFDGANEARVNLSALSDALDIGRASLYRSLELLEEKKIIKREGRRIAIIDRAGLCEIAVGKTQ